MLIKTSDWFRPMEAPGHCRTPSLNTNENGASECNLALLPPKFFAHYAPSSDSCFFSGCTSSDADYYDVIEDNNYDGLGKYHPSIVEQIGCDCDLNHNQCFREPPRPSYIFLYNDWLRNCKLRQTSLGGLFASKRKFS